VGFIKKEVFRRVQQRAGQTETLLFAEREHTVPVRFLFQPRASAGSPTAMTTSASRCGLKAAASAG